MLECPVIELLRRRETAEDCYSDLMHGKAVLMGTKKKTLAMEVQIVLVKTAHLTTKKMKTQAKQARARANRTSVQTTTAATVV